VAPLEHRSINVSARSLSEVVRMVTDGSLLVDTPYQRGDVWIPEQRRNLIKSLIMGIPIPAVILNARHLVREWRLVDPNAEIGWSCIDGKQRLTTFVQWYSGQLAIPAEWLGPEFVADGLDRGALVYFHGLTPAGQRYMSRWTIPLAEATLPTLLHEIDVYMLINRAGTAHTEGELGRAHAARTTTYYRVMHGGVFQGDVVRMTAEPRMAYGDDPGLRVQVRRITDNRSADILVRDLELVEGDVK
jgi:Protein of unknown function DUF262